MINKNAIDENATDDELHESFYQSEQYKESPTERLARELEEKS